MLSHNIQTLRKQQNMSQQALADRLFVVRQTVSKWEKGLSVPDADALSRLADALNTTVEALLGADLPEKDPEPSDVAEALARINEELAIQNRRRSRIWKIVAWVLAGIAAFHLLATALSIAAFSAYRVEPEVLTYEVTVEELPALPADR